MIYDNRFNAKLAIKTYLNCTKAGNGLILGQGWDTGHEQWIMR